MYFLYGPCTFFISNIEEQVSVRSSVRMMPFIQIIIYCPFLNYFPTFCTNFGQQIQFFVLDTVIYKLHFNILTQPINITQHQIKFMLSVFSVKHREFSGNMAISWECNQAGNICNCVSKAGISPLACACCLQSSHAFQTVVSLSW